MGVEVFSSARGVHFASTKEIRKEKTIYAREKTWLSDFYDTQVGNIKFVLD